VKTLRPFLRFGLLFNDALENASSHARKDQSSEATHTNPKDFRVFVAELS
jgi:hypothetical protein